MAAVDVRSTADVNAITEQAVAEFGGIDIVVANAGIARKVDLDQLDDEAWNTVLDVDLNGAWRCFRAALPHIAGRATAACWRRPRSRHGPGVGAYPHYTAAKAGLLGLIRTLAVEYGPDGITANAVAPGVIDTPQANDAVNSLGPEGVRAVAPKVPSGRVGQPEDIAYLYQFLASESFVREWSADRRGRARHLAGLD